MTPLLILMMACTDTADTGGETGGDTADSGADTAVVSADCSVQSLDPRTSSWSGGETITVTLACDDPSTVTSLNVTLEGVSYPATLGAIDGDSLSATFIPGALTRVGAFDWSLDGVGVAEFQSEDQLHFGVGLSEYGTRVDVHPTGRIGWGAKVSAANTNAAGDTMVISTASDHILVGAKTTDGDWQSATIKLSPMEVDVQTQGYSGTYGAEAKSWTYGDNDSSIQAIIFPILDGPTSSKQLTFLLAVFDGETLSTSTITMPYADLGLASVASGAEATSAPVVVSLDFTVDAAGALSSLGAILAVDNAKNNPDQPTLLESIDYSNVKGTWVRNWQWGAARVHHVSATVNTATAQRAVVAVHTGAEGLPTATLLESSSGEVLASTTFKSLSALSQVASAPVVEAKGSGLALAMLDASGAVSMGQITFSDLDSMSATTSTLSSEGQDILDLALRTGASGSVHLAARRGGQNGVCRYGACFLSVTSWTGDGLTAVSLAATPESFEVLSTQGDTTVVGSSSQPIAGALQAIGHNGGPNLLQAGDITVCAPAGWELQISGGALMATSPEGVHLSEPLPMDPCAELSCNIVDGRLLVSGTLITTADDGSTTRAPGLVTTGASGMGTAYFNKGDKIWVSVTPYDGTDNYQTSGGSPADTSLSLLASYSRTADDGRTVYGLSVGTLHASSLPAAGEQLTLDLTMSPWGTESSAQAHSQGAVVFGPSNPSGARIQAGTYSSEVPTDNPDVVSFSALSADQKLPDMVAQLPYSGAECGLATYFVPGTSSDPATNLAAAILLDTSDRSDCADLAQPMALMDPDGQGLSSVIMAAPVDGAELGGQWDLWAMVWDGAELLALPTQTVPAFESLAIVDIDGDTFDEVMLGIIGPADDDGVQSDPLSGLLLSGRGRWAMSRQLVRETTRMVDLSTSVVPNTGGIYGASLSELSDAVVLSGTAGQTAKGGCVSCDQPAAVRLFSWGYVLD